MRILQLLVPLNWEVVFPAPVPVPALILRKKRNVMSTYISGVMGILFPASVSMFSSFCDDSIPGFSFEKGIGNRPDFALNVGGLEIFAEHPGGGSESDFCKTFDVDVGKLV